MGPEMMRDSANSRLTDLRNLFNSNYTIVDGQKVIETNDTNDQGLTVLSYPRPGTNRTYSLWIKSKSFSLGWQTWFDDGGERILFGTSSNTLHIYPDVNLTANLQP